MTTSPSWLPIIPRESKSLPNAIKYPLARKYQDHDGSLSGTTILDETNIPYLEGLRDGGNKEVSKGAKILIEAIKKHDCIEFIIEC